MRKDLIPRLAIVVPLVGGCSWQIRQPFITKKGLVVDQGVVEGASQTDKYAASRGLSRVEVWWSLLVGALASIKPLR